MKYIRGWRYKNSQSTSWKSWRHVYYAQEYGCRGWGGIEGRYTMGKLGRRWSFHLSVCKFEEHGGRGS